MRRLFSILIFATLAATLLTACGGSPPPAATVSANAPTAESGGGSSNIPATIGIPTFQFVSPTEAAQVATAAAERDTVNPEAAERGRGRYVALECAECHGENGEGNEEGPSLLDYEASEDDFISFMRSGGSMGAEHQYATNRLSNSGGANLYQYLMSLSAS